MVSMMRISVHSIPKSVERNAVHKLRQWTVRSGVRLPVFTPPGYTS